MIRSCVIVAVGLVASASIAAAQTAPTPPMPALPGGLVKPGDPRKVDDGSLPVAERRQADYAPAGIRLGGFLLYPGLLTSVAHDDNIYATQNRRVSDVVTRVQPSVLLRSDWSVHSLEFHGVGEGVLHARHTRENHLNGSAGLRGTIDVQRDFRIGYFAGWSRAHEDRGSGDAIFRGLALDDPLASDRFQAGLSVNKAFNRFQLSVAGYYEGVLFQDGSINGVKVDQSRRDYSAYTLRTRLGYEISPLTQVFGEVGIDRKVYPSGDTDSTGTRAVAGLRVEASRLVNGEVYAGYLGRRYQSAFYPDIDTWTMGANFNWLATPLLTVGLLGERGVGEDFSGLTPGTSITTSVGLRADYEVLRNLLLRSQLSHEWASYRSSGRKDRLWSAQLSAIYMMNRNIHLSLDYRFKDRDSNLAGYDYRRNIVGGSIRAQF